MTDFTQACIEANTEVHSALITNFNISLLEKSEQGAGGDISSKADLLAEDIFVKHLSRFGAIESEESGLIGKEKVNIIIDPLDGSVNFASRFPYYGTSVAMLDGDGTVESVQVCNLANGDIFIKEKQERVKHGSLYSDILHNRETLSIPETGLFERAYAYPELVIGLQKVGYKFRSPGATALSLAYAQDATFFLFMGTSRIYDIVAGLALCEGMEVIVEEEYVIVSQSKNIAKNIENIIHRSII
ncbi:MAG: inositol monophosphatase [Sulfurovum sp.]|nr:inositol monophosphatase [Sulfurovum sp.]